MNFLHMAWFRWRLRRRLRYIQREHHLLRQRLQRLGTRVDRLVR